MSLRSEQDLLARLYTDPDLRRRFMGEPKDVGRDFGVAAETAAQLAAVAGDELDYFSETLFWKRFNEVAKLLPESRAAIGDGFEQRFREFAAGFVPDSIRKHLDDAYEFTGYLLANGEHAAVVSRERARLAFYGYARNFVFNKRSRPFIQLRLGKREFRF